MYMEAIVVYMTMLYKTYYSSLEELFNGRKL